MTDKQILETIYRWSKLAYSRNDSRENARQRFKDFSDFIEQEWQRADEQELASVEDVPDGDSMFVGFADTKEIERHRGLEIAEDGTVTGLE